MPIPRPNSGESEDAYIGRCMSAMSDDDKPQDQKLAICFSELRKAAKDEAFGRIRKAAAVVRKAVESAEISGSTTMDEGHWHTYEVDSNGDGVTVNSVPESIEPHFHLVSNFKVQTENGHTHQLNE